MLLLHPQRVIAAWIRSGVPLLKSDPARPGIKPHSLPEGALQVPILCNLGTKEGFSVKDGRFAGVWPANEAFLQEVRSKGGLACAAIDPLTAHECGNQRYFAIPWLDACLRARLPEDADAPLKAMPTSDAWLATMGGSEAVPASQFIGDPRNAGWLPNEAMARAWMQYVKDTALADETPPAAPTSVRLRGNELTWKADADLESGLAGFRIERDGMLLARLPEQPKNPFGRPIFQGLQYSDTPVQPLVPLTFTDKHPEPGKRHAYRVMAINTAGLESPASDVATAETPDKISFWEGFERRDFVVNGRKALLILPRQVAEGKPWIWRTEFFGHEPQADLALLGRGYHVASLDVQNMYGAPVALDHMDRFYEHVTSDRGLSAKTVLEGFSRGGLFSLNWAARHPDRVACIYNDAPVCDYKSWPAGRGRGQGSPADWKRCLEAYGFTEQQALDSRRNPVDHLEPLAARKIPLLHVCGEADEVVPIEENTQLLEQRYRALGGPITVIAKPGVGHHPHSLVHPGPIVSFVLAHTIGGSASINRRGTLRNSLIRFDREESGHVAFLGGSITEMNGFRPLVMDWLTKRFPRTRFQFTNAGISSTCSTTGAFRLPSEVLSQGPVDLLFAEFAVNDDQDSGAAPRECIRGMEGIVRQVRLENPNADIVMIHFSNPALLKSIGEGKTPVSIGSHEDVARHYAVPTVNVAAELVDRITTGEFSWERYGGVHPGAAGNEFAARLIEDLLQAEWKTPLPSEAAAIPHSLPAQPLDEGSYFAGRFLDPASASLGEGWSIKKPDWGENPKQWRERFRETPLLTATRPGSELTLSFEGRAIGAYLLAGPDAGAVEYSIDEGPSAQLDLFHAFSAGLHYPRTVIFAADLKPGAHRLKLRVVEPASRSGAGTAVRIVKFAAN
jgi:pimeloyl-ACP methyl ester carboxylesterase/lysophospholipase L1-like esterase